MLSRPITVCDRHAMLSRNDKLGNLVLALCQTPTGFISSALIMSRVYTCTGRRPTRWTHQSAILSIPTVHCPYPLAVPLRTAKSSRATSLRTC